MTDTNVAAVGLRTVSPYWYSYKTMAKGRWFGREILELVSTEFRDRSLEYYVSFSALSPLLFYYSLIANSVMR